MSAIGASLVSVAIAAAGAPAPDQAAAAPAAETAAPAKRPDEIVLRDGGFVRGEIVELASGSHVTITVAGTGELRTIPWDSVAEVKRGGEATSPPAAPTSPSPVPQPPTQPLAPMPGAPLLHIEVEGGDTVLLYRVVANIATSNASGMMLRSDCAAPCDRVIDGRDGQSFFFGGPNITASRAFTLLDKRDAVTARVDPGSRGLFAGGFVLVTLGVTLLITGIPLAIVGAGVGSGTALPSMRDAGIGVSIGGGLAIGASVPMLIFGRTRVTWKTAGARG